MCGSIKSKYELCLAAFLLRWLDTIPSAAVQTLVIHCPAPSANVFNFFFIHSRADRAGNRDDAGNIYSKSREREFPTQICTFEKQHRHLGR